MIPSDKELDKVFSLFRKYTELGVYEQQKINMYDYIRLHWNNG